MTIDELVTYFIAVALSTRMESRLSSGVDINVRFLPCSKTLSPKEPETQPYLGGSEPAWLEELAFDVQSRGRLGLTTGPVASSVPAPLNFSNNTEASTEGTDQAA